MVLCEKARRLYRRYKYHTYTYPRIHIRIFHLYARYLWTAYFLRQEHVKMKEMKIIYGDFIALRVQLLKKL